MRVAGLSGTAMPGILPTLSKSQHPGKDLLDKTGAITGRLSRNPRLCQPSASEWFCAGYMRKFT